MFRATASTTDGSQSPSSRGSSLGGGSRQHKSLTSMRLTSDAQAATTAAAAATTSGAPAPAASTTSITGSTSGTVSGSTTSGSTTGMSINFPAMPFRNRRKPIQRQRTWGGKDTSKDGDDASDHHPNSNHGAGSSPSFLRRKNSDASKMTSGASMTTDNIATTTETNQMMNSNNQHQKGDTFHASMATMDTSASTLGTTSTGTTTNNVSNNNNTTSHVPVISIAKTINQLLINPSNRCCADCRSSLVDSSQIHASFRPKLVSSDHSDNKQTLLEAATNTASQSASRSRLLIRSDFGDQHKHFAPPPPPTRGTPPERTPTDAAAATTSPAPMLLSKEQRRNSSGDITSSRSHQQQSQSSSQLLPTNGIAETTKNNLTSNNSKAELDRHSDHGSSTTSNPYNISDIMGETKDDSHAIFGSNSHSTTLPPLYPQHQHQQPSAADNKKDTLVDPAVLALRHVPGHGVFLCAQCAQAHKMLGPAVTVVKHVQQYHTWTPEDALLMKQAGGNVNSSDKLYEKFVPELWKKRRPNHASPMSDRLTFCRAKYEALSFCLPPIGNEQAWHNLLEVNDWANDPHNQAQTAELRNVVNLCLHARDFENGRQSRRQTLLAAGAYGTKAANNNKGALEAAAAPPMPQRLVDYFCVVGSSGFLDPNIMQREMLDLSTLASPEDVMLEPRVTDCYPPSDHHSDTEFPEHVATFVLPEGCCPSDQQKSPFFFSFVLTSATGHRLYGASLRLYDEAIETQELRDIMEKSGYQGPFPTWLPSHRQQPSSNNVDGDKSVGSSVNSSDYMDIVYLPKCLVILSHYPFFDLFRNFLLQLYRITLVEAPLPIERFIANFCCEVPLPPMGKVEVKFGFTVKDIWSIQRPAENRLPLAGFSYKPIFACLSVGNIMALVGSLMMEGRVAICSRHYALLTPVCEALLSFLFPLQWQGMYIPVMPYAMLDILDAPVPFIVGLHARYLIEIKPAMRPHGVIYVDLDRDIVHLGYDEDSNTPRMLPSLPEKGALKLRGKLEDHAACLYITPDNAKHEGSSITNGHGQFLPDYKRESYAAAYAPGQSSVNDRSSSGGSLELALEKENKQRRRAVLRSTDKAYHENELLTPITGFLSEQGQLYNREPMRKIRTQKSAAKGKMFGGLRRLRSQGSMREEEANGVGQSHNGRILGSLLDLEEPPGFSVTEIRDAFLRFFVSLLKSYEQFLNSNNPNQLFRVDDFLADLNLSLANYEFVKQVVQTQMFQRFLEDRETDPCDPLFLFFDECIIAKQNRSRRLGVRQRDTPFLDDPSGAIKETFTPPPPSNWGLPDDGRAYQYGAFPKLNYELFGKIRPPIQWANPKKSASLRNLHVPNFPTVANTRAWQHEYLSRTLAPGAGVAWAAKQGLQSLEAAINALSQNKLIENDASSTSFFSSGKSISPSKGKKSSLEKSLPPRPGAKQLRRTGFVRDLSATTLAAAENVLLNARRFKGVLLIVIVKLQAYVRKYLDRRRYLRFLRALRFVQYKWRRHVPEGLEEMDALEKARISIIRIQRGARAYLLVKGYHRKLRAIALIQRWSRGCLCRVRIKNLERACSRIQIIVRSRRARYGLQLLIRLVVNVQAKWRGHLVRQRISSLNESRMSRYREQIFLLWKRSHTPLSYRTKFWPMISDRCGFLRLRIAESELERLWIVLEVDFNTGSVTESNMDHKHADELRLGKLLGITDHTYWRYLKVQGMTESVLLFPAEERRNTELRLGGDRVEAERIQIYERLSASNPSIAAMLITLYGLFKIDKKDKHKKFRLAEIVWTDQSRAQQSENLMMHVFPELEEASNIIFNPPAKKTLKRFRNVNPLPPRLGRSHWAHSILKSQISRNVREVAVNALQRHTVLSQPKMKASVDLYLDRRCAMMKAPGKHARKALRRELIVNLLVIRTWVGKN